jgi:hypothetical protein
MRTIYLVCGVPGSGKTWVCNQLKSLFTYVPHDDFEKGFHLTALKAAAREKPLLTDCPFGESSLRTKLEAANFKVIPYFIVEDLETIKSRYKSRTRRDLPKNQQTRAASIIDRAKEWKAKYGTSEQVLKMLKDEGWKARPNPHEKKEA